MSTKFKPFWYNHFMNKIKNKFSTRLKELRESKGISQKQLAIELGYTQVCISRWESGNRQPELDDVISVAMFFKVTTDYLLGLSDFI